MPMDVQQFIRMILSGQLRPSRIVHELDRDGKPLTVYEFQLAEWKIHAHFADSEREIFLPSHIVPWHYSGREDERIPIDNHILAMVRHYAEEAEPTVAHRTERSTFRPVVLAITGVVAVVVAIVLGLILDAAQRPQKETLALFESISQRCLFFSRDGIRCWCMTSGGQWGDEFLTGVANERERESHQSLDGWHRPLQFEFSLATQGLIRAVSGGPDRTVGTGDDLTDRVCQSYDGDTDYPLGKCTGDGSTRVCN